MNDYELRMSIQTLLDLCPFTDSESSDFYYIFLDIYKDKLSQEQVDCFKKISHELEEKENYENEINVRKMQPVENENK